MLVGGNQLCIKQSRKFDGERGWKHIRDMGVIA
jgi:hypothetical protein